MFDVDPMYAIQARINDKLNRIKSKESYQSENDLLDLTGYLILLQVHRDEVDKKLKNTMDSAEVIESDEVPFSYEWNIKNNTNETRT